MASSSYSSDGVNPLYEQALRDVNLLSDRRLSDLVERLTAATASEKRNSEDAVLYAAKFVQTQRANERSVRAVVNG